MPPGYYLLNTRRSQEGILSVLTSCPVWGLGEYLRLDMETGCLLCLSWSDTRSIYGNIYAAKTLFSS